jgi:tetratricopeptide (TPR) repeat protein
LGIYRQLAQSNPQAYLPKVAMTLRALGGVQSDGNDYASTEKSFQEALKIYRQLAQANPQAYLPDVAMTLDSLGDLYLDRTDYSEAVKSFQEGIENLPATGPGQSPNILAKRGDHPNRPR